MTADARIILATDIAGLELPWREECLCVHHKTYPTPRSAGARYQTFDEFKQSPRAALAGCRRLVIVGLNKIITPGNRTDEVFEVLFNNTTELAKVSIDHTLFVSEPWRAWFHFGLTGAPYREYTYSYLAQSHYNAFRDRLTTENPFSLAAIAQWGAGVVRATYDSYFAPLEVEEVETTAALKRAYAQLKAKCFAEEHSIARILTRLGRFAQTACPRRSIPSPNACFKRPQQRRVVATDLKIDRYLVAQLRELCDLTNAIGRTFNR